VPYDLIVIGSGPGGYSAAIRAGQYGLKTALVEKQAKLGGTCLLVGCIPTKALLHTAGVWEYFKHPTDQGILCDNPRLDYPKVVDRKNNIVNKHSKGVEMLLKRAKVERISGYATLQGGGKVEVDSGSGKQTLEAKNIIIATGSEARMLPGLEPDRERILTNVEILDLTEIPKSLAIIGAGAVGVEFGSIFHRMGSKVTIVEMLPRIVPVEDEAVSAELDKSFRKQGIKVLTAARVTSATSTANSVEIQATAADGKTHALTADILLVATGRAPVTTGLGAEEAGIRMEKGYIKVDSMYRTSVPNVSAIGDVIAVDGMAHPQLAHVSSAEGILVAERLAGRDVQPLNYDHIPSCTYCDPEIGSVGLTEAEARTRGYDVRVGSFPFGVLGRAKMAGETEGFVKIVADTRYDEVLGVHMIGSRSTELVAEAALALRLECTVEELIKTVHAHPTFSEAVGEAAHATHGAAIHL
jgi:dihydrolipoamide dehydrogenase